MHKDKKKKQTIPAVLYSTVACKLSVTDGSLKQVAWWKISFGSQYPNKGKPIKICLYR